VDELLLDSTIVIDLTKAVPGAVTFARSGAESRLLIHVVVEAEVLAGAANKRDLRGIADALREFRRVRPTDSDFDHCIAFVRRHSLAHGIGWQDCLIAATALRTGLPVVTLNDKHFRAIRGVRVIRPY
jgi:predicted nucleic acid-binding protein